MAKRAEVLMLVSTLLMLVLAPSVRADVSKPVWTKGDYWSYTVTDMEMAGFSGSGTLRFDVIGEDSVTIGGSTYECYRTKTWLNLSMGSISVNMPGDAWFRKSDLADAKETFAMTISVPPTTLTVTMTTTTKPPMTMEWPLTAGHTWTAAAETTMVTETEGFPPQTVTGTNTSQFTVQASQSVTVQAGTFSTMPIRQTLWEDLYALSFWSADVGYIVREQYFNDTDVQQGEVELTSFRHQSGGAADILGNPVLWIGLIILIVVIVAVAVAMRRRKRPALAQVPPYVTPGVPPPQGPPRPPQSPGSGPPFP